jgi:hypothetical protein
VTTPGEVGRTGGYSVIPPDDSPLRSAPWQLAQLAVYTWDPMPEVVVGGTVVVVGGTVVVVGGAVVVVGGVDVEVGGFVVVGGWVVVVEGVPPPQAIRLADASIPIATMQDNTRNLRVLVISVPFYNSLRLL